MTLGFIGIGKMGSAMVKNLSKNNEVKVFDMQKSNYQALMKQPNVKFCQTIQEMNGSKRVFLMLPDDSAVSNVCIGDNGLFQVLQNNSRIYDCSTISPKTSQLLHQHAQELNICFVDAPVSGGNTDSHNI